MKMSKLMKCNLLIDVISKKWVVKGWFCGSVVNKENEELRIVGTFQWLCQVAEDCRLSILQSYPQLGEVLSLSLTEQLPICFLTSSKNQEQK